MSSGKQKKILVIYEINYFSDSGLPKLYQEYKAISAGTVNYSTCNSHNLCVWKNINQDLYKAGLAPPLLEISSVDFYSWNLYLKCDV